MKRKSLIGLITGLLFAIVGFEISSLLTKYKIHSVIWENGVRVKIEWLYYLYRIMLIFALFGIAIVITASFCLICKKIVSKYCKLNTSAISLAISAVVAMGLYCVFLFGLTNSVNNPITHLASYIIGSICFFVFLALIFKYAKLKKYNLSALAVIIDILFSVLYVIPFFMLHDMLYTFLSDVMHITGLI